MFESAAIHLVIVSMIVYLVLCNMIPKMIKKSTGIETVDNVVMTVLAQQSSCASNVLLVGLSVLITVFILQEKPEIGA